MKNLNDILNKELTKREVYNLILGEEPLKSGNKVAQEKRLRSKCDFYTVGKGRGTKYIITEIFEIDRPIYDGRINNQGGNNSKTAHLLEDIIINALIGQQLENREQLRYTQLLLAKNEALITMKMVKEEYIRRYYKDYDGLEDIIDEYLIERFFMINHNRIQRRLESGLNSLTKKSLIYYNKVLRVKVVNNNDQLEFRKASEEEKSTIIEVEKKIMIDMLSNEYELKKINKSLIYTKNLYRKFYYKCIEEFQQMGFEYIQGYCSAYEIITTEKLLSSEIAIYNLDESVRKIKSDLKRMCNENMVNELEKVREKIENSVKDIVFGQMPKSYTNHIDEHIESIRLFTEMIL